MASPRSQEGSLERRRTGFSTMINSNFVTMTIGQWSESSVKTINVKKIFEQEVKWWSSIIGWLAIAILRHHLAISHLLFTQGNLFIIAILILSPRYKSPSPQDQSSNRGHSLRKRVQSPSRSGCLLTEWKSARSQVNRGAQYFFLMSGTTISRIKSVKGSHPEPIVQFF